MTPNATRLAAAVASLVECLCKALAEEGAGPTCFCGVVPGDQVAWDYCGECSGGNCGMGYVKVNSVFATSTFPGGREFSKCNAYLAVELTVGALRCAPMPDEDGALPSEEEMQESWLATVADMGAIHRAIACCGFSDYFLGNYEPQGPQGGCVGGEWTVTVLLDG